MKRFVVWAMIVGILFSVTGESQRTAASPAPQILTGILNKMEKAHQELKSLKAEVVQQKTNPQINITDTSLGSIIYKPAAGKDKGKVRVDYVRPTKDIFAIVGENVTFYQPRINQVFKNSVNKLAKGKTNGLSQLVGLDASVKSLGGSFNIEYVKDETVNGQATTVLRLVPKNNNVSYSQLELWVNNGTGIPAQWKFVERNGDYTVLTLKNVQLNANIPDSAFAVNIPNGTKVVDRL